MLALCLCCLHAALLSFIVGRAEDGGSGSDGRIGGWGSDMMGSDE